MEVKLHDKLDTRRRWMASFTLQSIYPPGKTPLVPIGWEAGWTSEPICTR